MKQLFQNMNAQTRTLAMAGGGAIVAAAMTMFLPTALLEGITGATGLSELFPATAAPLGDTARALIAFGTGVLTFAILAILIPKKKVLSPKMATAAAPKDDVSAFERTTAPSFQNAETASAGSDGVSLLGQLRGKVEGMIARARGKGDITDLADLPKLRSRDIHPDAPARRPISANRDIDGVGKEPATLIPTVDLPFVKEPVQQEAPAPTAPAIVEQVVSQPDAYVAPAASLPEEAAPVVPAAEASASRNSLSDIVDRLESVLAARKAQLEKLEDIARRAIAETAQRETAVAEQAQAQAEPVSPVVEALDDEPAGERRLEVVEPTGTAIKRPRNGDDALRSALETLHRMNARSV